MSFYSLAKVSIAFAAEPIHDRPSNIMRYIIIRIQRCCQNHRRVLYHIVALPRRCLLGKQLAKQRDGLPRILGGSFSKGRAQCAMWIKFRISCGYRSFAM